MSKKMIIQKFNKENYSEWNNFLKNTKNGTFLFNRDYMDYHSDRFSDNSLMFYDSKKTLIALLPASIHKNELRSHGGLTYGGFITNRKMRTDKMLIIFETLIDYLKKEKIKRIIYKSIPHIYHLVPSEEDLYSLFRFGFKLSRRDVSSSINMRTTKIKGQKINGAKKASKIGMSIVKTNDSKNIFEIINKNLLEKYNVNAVHSSKEMNLLHKKFKENIHMYELMLNKNTIGGAILYVDNNVVHAQYLATTDEAKMNRGLDFMMVSFVDKYKEQHEWFDFGISTEDSGKYLNTGLIKSKEEFNLSSICYDFYELEV